MLKEEALHQILDGLTAGVFCTTRDGEFLYVNQVFAQLLGYDKSEILKLRSTALYCHPREREAWKQLLEQNRSHRTWLEWKRSDGRRLWVKNHARCMELAEHGVVYVGVVEATTPPYRQIFAREERSWVEDELATHFEQQFDELPICITYKDRSGLVLYGNQTFCDNEARCAKHELRQKHLTDHDLYPPSLANRYRQDDHVVCTTGIVLDYVEPHVPGRLRSPAGDPASAPLAGDSQPLMQVHVVKNPVWNHAGEVCGVLVFFWEESDESLALRHTIRRAQQDALISASAFDIVYEHDLEGRFRTLNEAGQQLTGYSEAEFSVRTIEEVVSPVYRKLAREMIARKRESREETPITKYQLEIRHGQTGQPIPLEVVTILVREAGQPSFIRGHARDMRPERQAEEYLRHNMRNYLESLLEVVGREQGSATGALADFALRLSRRIQVMQWLLAETSPAGGAAQLDAGEHLAAFAARVTEVHRLTEEGGAVLATHCAPGLLISRDVLAKILSVVHELTLNALKHALSNLNNGRIDVRIDDLPDSYLLSVADNGPGLPRAQYVEAISNGRGLSLVSEIVNKLHGTMTYESPIASSSNGTKFVVQIPKFSSP